ncbi:hypothetical protein ATL39_1975 [Sinobaca qinghaiensis]|uniref:Tripartite ATP-independent transporter DctM subunit n=1 Tax=Sinobaca qinghaiensis TaxID=342944 RepID=A0A419V2N3_9BACL|nr:hypothetical protein [Sinobaca qinghaiensis]RKD72779.1 hypothetical protein ATL39_1975 [Sinobaca qinghaiensis]
MQKISIIERLLGYITFLAVLFYLADVIFAMPGSVYIYSTAAAVLLLFSLLKMNRFTKSIILLLLGAGLWMFMYYQEAFSIMLFSLGENMNLLALFILVPLFGVFMSGAGFLKALQHALQKREQKHRSRPYLFGYVLTAGMGSLLNLGSMPLVHKIGSESFTSFENKRFGLLIIRGFGFCMLWSPYFVNVALILVLYDLSWTDIGGYGLIMAACYSVIVALFFRSSVFSIPDERVNRSENKAPAALQKQLRLFLLFVVILLSLSFLLEMMLPFGMLTVVVLLGLLYPLIWAAVLNMFRSYVEEAHEEISWSFKRLYNELGIFITAGFFGEALSLSPAGEMLTRLLMDWSGGLVPALSALLIAVAMLLAFIGIHPVIIVIGIGGSLDPALFGVTPSFMGMLMLAAWTLATQFSPFSGSVLMASHLMNVPAWKLVKKNTPFLLTVYVVFIFLLSALHWFQSTGV